MTTPTEPERTLPDVDRLGRELARACGADTVQVSVRDTGTGRLVIRAEVVVDARAALTHPDPAPDAHLEAPPGQRPG